MCRRILEGSQLKKNLLKGLLHILKAKNAKSGFLWTEWTKDPSKVGNKSESGDDRLAHVCSTVHACVCVCAFVWVGKCVRVSV